MLKMCKIEEQFPEKCLRDLEKGDFCFLLEIPEKERKKLLKFIQGKYEMGKCSMETNLRLSLSPLL